MSFSPITSALATAALADTVSPQQALSIEEIIHGVARFYNLEPDDLTGARRTKDLALSRQVAMYLAREETSSSLVHIGMALGNRDHTTVMHGHDKIEREIEEDDKLRREVLAIKAVLYNTQSA
jgi:chromosomal replication initiator protein